MNDAAKASFASGVPGWEAGMSVVIQFDDRQCVPRSPVELGSMLADLARAAVPFSFTVSDFGTIRNYDQRHRSLEKRLNEAEDQNRSLAEKNDELHKRILNMEPYFDALKRRNEEIQHWRSLARDLAMAIGVEGSFTNESAPIIMGEITRAAVNKITTLTEIVQAHASEIARLVNEKKLQGAGLQQQRPPLDWAVINRLEKLEEMVGGIAGYCGYSDFVAEAERSAKEYHQRTTYESVLGLRERDVSRTAGGPVRQDDAFLRRMEETDAEFRARILSEKSERDVCDPAPTKKAAP